MCTSALQPAFLRGHERKTPLDKLSCEVDHNLYYYITYQKGIMTIQKLQKALSELGGPEAEVYLSVDDEGNYFFDISDVGLADNSVILYPGRLLKPEEVLSRGKHHKARV